MKFKLVPSHVMFAECWPGHVGYTVQSFDPILWGSYRPVNIYSAIIEHCMRSIVEGE